MHSQVFFGLSDESASYYANVILHQFLIGVINVAHLEAVVDLSDVLYFILQLVELEMANLALVTVSPSVL